jgi:predicted HTH domain antitoxin
MLSKLKVNVEADLDADALRSVTDSARTAAVLEVYRLGQIGSGGAARLLGMERPEFLDLAASRHIPTIQITPSELDDELGVPGH